METLNVRWDTQLLSYQQKDRDNKIYLGKGNIFTKKVEELDDKRKSLIWGTNIFSPLPVNVVMLVQEHNIFDKPGQANNFPLYTVHGQSKYSGIFEKFKFKH
jgi:hypothetical protein